MYGIIGQMTVIEGQCDKLISILLDGSANMPGCLSYIIAKDSEDENAIWITEVWERKEHHQSSISLPQVKEAINLGRPMIKVFGMRVVTVAVGGVGD